MAKTPKRERQYEHIKESAKQRGGRDARRAEEIAARTVNKERAQAGETRGSSRGGQRSRQGASERTKDELYEEAKRRDIKGRSSMNKDQLRSALGR
ncbi:plasmid stabilization protein [Streptomyces sp. JJ38]|uniref:plasmid stabilization protein n=1 Tax=Streptomyces sp. JJ38 TaxID=2738128 RepID=UPI001C55977B|nr:plasmid stabilization protein [Streptomyces sp. JJ38]MBW1597353.1 plasmid stabilization protein [Streptomyces sp. JJ38]